MEITRTSLRAQRNQQVPTQVSQGLTQQKGGYGEELREQLQTLGDVRRKAPVITAKQVEAVVSPTEQYTKDAVKTAMEKLKKFIMGQGLGKDDDVAQTTTTTPTTGGGGGGNKVKDFFSALTNDEIGLLSTDELVARDNRMYGDTFPDGAIGIGSKSTDDFSKNPEYQSTVGDFEKQRLAQVMSSLPSDYKQTEQKAFDDAEAYRKLVESGLDKTISGEDAQVNVGPGNMGTFGFGTLGKGAPSGASLPSGSFGSGSIKTIESSPTSKVDTNISRHTPGTSKNQPSTTTPTSTTTTFGGAVDVAKSLKNIKAKQEAPKQTVASLPSNYKSTEAEAFAKAKSYKDSKAKGDAAAKATGTPTKPKAGSFGISAEGKKTAEANKEAKRKEAKKKATKQKTKSKSTSKSSSKKSSSKKSNTGSKKSSRGAKGSGKKGGTSKGGSKGTSGSKKSSRGAKGGGSSKGGTSKGGARTNRRRSRRRCDIRCKFDISILTNQNLIRDDLADVAYFVKDLQEIN